MSFKTLLDTWAKSRKVTLTETEYAVRLPLETAAKLHALADLFDGPELNDVITDLLEVAVNEAEAAMPYVAGERVIREDEFGDPIYEDQGPTPKFEKLRRAHLKKLGGND